MRFVWCEWCCERHRKWMSLLRRAGRVVSKSGPLKAAVRCQSCRAEMPVGGEATAFTLDGGPAYSEWEEEYLALDSKKEAVTEEVEGSYG